MLIISNICIAIITKADQSYYDGLRLSPVRKMKTPELKCNQQVYTAYIIIVFVLRENSYNYVDMPVSYYKTVCFSYSYSIIFLHCK